MGYLKDLALRKIASMKARVIAGPQKAGSKMVVRRNITITDENELKNMVSSWVEYFMYDEKTHIFTMKVKGNSTLYTWENVDSNTALRAQRGATCKTDDATGEKRWWPGKQNSLGAAYWYILRPYNSTASKAYKADNTIGGYDVYAGDWNTTGVSKPTSYAAQNTNYYTLYRPVHKGRPTKAELFQRNWAKLHNPKYKLKVNP